MSLEDSAKRMVEFVKLAEKATPGPWYAEDPGQSCWTQCSPDGCPEDHESGYRYLVGPERSPHDESTFLREDAVLMASSRKIPDDFAEIVREARRFADALLDYESMSPLGNQAAKFLNATAPIVGEEGQG